MPIKVEATTRDGELRISLSNAGEPIPHETMQGITIKEYNPPVAASPFNGESP
jgi:signal transduction histidine kinase